MGVLGFLDRLEVSLPREPGEAYEVFCSVLFCQPTGLAIPRRFFFFFFFLFYIMCFDFIV